MVYQEGRVACSLSDQSWAELCTFSSLEASGKPSRPRSYINHQLVTLASTEKHLGLSTLTAISVPTDKTHTRWGSRKASLKLPEFYYISHKQKTFLISWVMVTYTLNPRTREAEASEYLSSRPPWSTVQVLGQSGLQRETCPKRSNKQTNHED